MSYYRQDDFGQEIKKNLEKELDGLRLDPSKKNQIIDQWKEDKKSLWNNWCEWIDQEVVITLPQAAIACLVILLLVGVPLVNLEKKSYKIIKTTEEIIEVSENELPEFVENMVFQSF